jgi:hypothetical protein
VIDKSVQKGVLHERGGALQIAADRKGEPAGQVNRTGRGTRKQSLPRRIDIRSASVFV